MDPSANYIILIALLAVLAFAVYKSVRKSGLDNAAALASLICSTIFIVYTLISGTEFGLSSLLGALVLLLSIYYIVDWIWGKRGTK